MSAGSKSLAKKVADERLGAATRIFFRHLDKAPPPARLYPLLMLLFRETVLKGRANTDVLTNSEIASLLGVTTKTVNNCIADLKEAGWLASRKSAHDGTVRMLLTPGGTKSLYDLAARRERTVKRGLISKKQVRIGAKRK